MLPFYRDWCWPGDAIDQKELCLIFNRQTYSTLFIAFLLLLAKLFVASVIHPKHFKAARLRQTSVSSTQRLRQTQLKPRRVSPLGLHNSKPNTGCREISSRTSCRNVLRLMTAFEEPQPSDQRRAPPCQCLSWPCSPRRLQLNLLVSFVSFSFSHSFIEQHVQVQGFFFCLCSYKLHQSWVCVALWTET